MLTIKEVLTANDLKRFVTFPNKLYKDNPYYVPDLISDAIHTLDKRKNPAFEFSEGAYFLAYDGKEIVGRIGVLVNHRSNEKWQQNRARFTHVDFIDNGQVSKLLFDTVETWAQERGYEAIHGPMGLTDMDHQGMLIEGYDELDMFITLYNYPYYANHLEKLGYRKEVDWLEYQVIMPDQPIEFLSKLSQRIALRYDFRLIHFNHKKEILPWAKEIFALYNDAYSTLYGTSTLSDAQIEGYIKAFFGFVNPDFIKLVVDKNNKIIAFGLAMPSLSLAMKKAKGKLFPFGFLPLLKAIKKNDILDLYLVAVHPQYQGTGANALLMDSILDVAQKYGIKYAESGPELESNKQVQSQWKYFTTRQHKRRRAYIKQLTD